MITPTKLASRLSCCCYFFFLFYFISFTIADAVYFCSFAVDFIMALTILRHLTCFFFFRLLHSFILVFAFVFIFLLFETLLPDRHCRVANLCFLYHKAHCIFTFCRLLIFLKPIFFVFIYIYMKICIYKKFI